MASFVSRYFQSPDGLRLHYREFSGPKDARVTVLCLPGMTRNARDFEDLAAHLAQRYRVLCADFRGRGLSEYARDPATYVPPVYVNDMATLLKVDGTSQVAIIGTSLGGMVGTLMAAVMPGKVLGLVINDIGPEIAPAGLQRIASYVGKGKPVKSWEEAAAAVQSIDGATFPDYGQGDWLKVARRRFTEGPDGMINADYDFNIAQVFGSAITQDMWPFFLRLRAIPSLLLRGAITDLLTPEAFARMGLLIPTMTCVEVPNRGHAPYLDEPVALAAIDTFLAKLPRRLGVVTRLRRSLSATGFLMGLKRAGKL